jgi:hypothetical protein
VSEKREKLEEKLARELRGIWCDNWNYGVACADAILRGDSFSCQRARSIDAWRRGRATDRSWINCVLHSCAACNVRGSDHGVARRLRF